MCKRKEKKAFNSREGDFVTEQVPRVLMIQNHPSCTDRMNVHCRVVSHSKISFIICKVVRKSPTVRLTLKWQELKRKVVFQLKEFQLNLNFKPVCFLQGIKAADTLC